VQKVSVSVERSLLDKADAFAKRHTLNRSELFSKGVASFIAMAGANSK
jgi:metal-responsive CopG/Arc/MetJ family transcriptional regulator